MVLVKVFQQAWANSVDSDQILQNAASDQGLYQGSGKPEK